MTEASVERPKPLDTLIGFLSAAAIAVAMLGIVYRPTRLALPAAVIALGCTIAGGRYQKLTMWAVYIAGASWFLGMIFAVITENPIW